MKDYSNYHEVNSHEKINQNGKEIFEHSLNSSFESYEVVIDGVTTRAIIQNNYPSDGSVKTILGRVDEFDIGSTVDWNSEKWLVISYPVDNQIYKKSSLQLCNSTLKWQQDNIIHDYPCIYFNDSITYDRVKTGDYMSIKEGQIGVLVSENENTLSIKVGQRFIYKNDAWKVEFIDKTKDGLLNIVLSIDSIKATDNLELSIADYHVEDTNEETDTSDTSTDGSFW